MWDAIKGMLTRIDVSTLMLSVLLALFALLFYKLGHIGMNDLVLFLCGPPIACLALLHNAVMASRLESVSDEAFLERYYRRHSGQPGRVLEVRARVGRCLCIAPEKLSPEQERGFLEKRFNWFGDFSWGWEDLSEDAWENVLGTPFPPGEPTFETVGALVEALAVEGRTE